ncbi:MAG: DUF6478 family protein [Pikeienuella sp.]
MARAKNSNGKDLGSRIFAWYWAKQAARVENTGEVRTKILQRRAELDKIAQKLESRIAHQRLTPDAKKGEGWTTYPDFLLVRVEPGVWRQVSSDTKFGRGLSVFHDCSSGAYTLAQRPNRSESAKHRYELFFESYEFNGSYLSMALAVPGDLRRPLTGEVLQAVVDMRSSRPLKAFLRLNISGPRGRDVLYAEAEVGSGRQSFEFDMSFAAFELSKDDNIWLDFIVDRPRMVEFSVQDMSISLVRRDEL